MEKQIRDKLNKLDKELDSQKADYANQVDSTESKAVQRRLGNKRYNAISVVANKRACFVGVHTTTDYYYTYFDLVSRGIPFHTKTWSDFVANWNTENWKSQYDMIIIGGGYISYDTVSPAESKLAVVAMCATTSYTSGSSEIIFAHNTITTTGSDFAFKVGDEVVITGCTVNTGNNKKAIVRAVTAKVLTFDNNTFTAGAETAAITIKRNLPYKVIQVCDYGMRRSYVSSANQITFGTTTIVTTGTIFAGIKVGDTVTVSGCIVNAGNNKSAQVTAVSADQKTLTFAAGTFTAGAETAAITIKHADAYWYQTAFGINGSGDNLFSIDCGSTPIDITYDTNFDVKPEEQSTTYTLVGSNPSAAYTSGWTKVAYNTTANISVCSKKDDLSMAICTTEPSYFLKRIDLGKLIWVLRGTAAPQPLKSHVCFNRINSKKYVGWGYDGDRTNSASATANIAEVNTLNRPLEYSVVTSKLDDASKEKFRALQSKGASIVSHSVSHFGTTGATAIPTYKEWIESINDLDLAGLVSNGIHYLTGNLSDKSILDSAINSGYLLCGYVNTGFRGRNNSYVPFGKNSDSLMVSAQLGIFPLYSTFGADDIYIMGTYGSGAVQKFKDLLAAADIFPYEIPLVWYFHDSPSDSTWVGTGEFINGGYYDLSNGMERRKDYYRQVFAYVDSLGYRQLKRSQAIEYIYDCANCVSISGETVTTGVSIATKVVTSRHISGLTVAIPVDSSKQIANVKVYLSDNTVAGNITTNNFERSSDNNWLYVGFDALQGKEHVILVTYA